IELYSPEPRIPDRELLATMASIGAQIGQFVERRRAERSVRESEERKRAILASALDCVITIDHNGRVLEFNQPAEETFGYRAEGELRGSRMRVVKAADEERRRLGRDRHGGAQQRLVHLHLLLGLVRARLATDPASARSALDEAIAELAAGTAELRELARGIHPAVLAD